MKKEKKDILNTYNNSARQLAKYFAGIGPRTEDIEKTFDLIKRQNPCVLEIGCGDGRDAQEILKMTDCYDGFDISKEMIKLAKQKNILGNFFVADVEKYNFKKQYDIIFSFASLLHSDKEQMQKILIRYAKALKKDGVFFIFLKMKDKYLKDVKEDEFGRRAFYFYTPEMIGDLAKKHYETIFIEKRRKGKTDWFSILLRKK